MKIDTLKKELSGAIEALIISVSGFKQKLSGGMIEPSELLKKYYLFADHLISHIQKLDNILLVINEDIQKADKLNNPKDVQLFGTVLDSAVEIRKLCEDFFSSAERDIEAKQMEPFRLGNHAELLLRKLVLCKNSLI